MFGGRITRKSWRSETIIGNQNCAFHKGIIMTPGAPSCLIFNILAPTSILSNGLVVKALDSQSRGPMFKPTGVWTLSRSVKLVPEISGNLVVKSKLPPQSGSSLEASNWTPSIKRGHKVFFYQTKWRESIKFCICPWNAKCIYCKCLLI